jgi:Ca-activated chloride channel homolog
LGRMRIQLWVVVLVCLLSSEIVAKDEPLLFAVLIDVSGSNAATADSVKQAAFQLFQGLGTGQNQGYLVLFNDMIGFSREGISAAQAKQVLDATRFHGGTAVYDAIEQTCKQKMSRSGNPAMPRRVILLISDGEDNASYATQKRAEETALQEGVSVFALETRIARGRGNKFLRDLSQKTGGFFTDQDLKKAVPAALAAIGAQ